MIMRIFVAIIILTALIVGILVLYVQRDLLVRIIYFRDFFDVAIPILGFGALIKYLCTCTTGCNCTRCGTGCKCNCSCCKSCNTCQTTKA